MCKRAHTSGALDADTVLLWGEAGATSAAEDARALAAEAPSSPGGEGEGVEESKVQPLDDGGGRGCATDMPVELVLKGVQNEVAMILKADPSSIPTVRIGGGGGGEEGGGGTRGGVAASGCCGLAVAYQ